MFRSYSHILGFPHVRSRLAAVLLSSMPLGMLSLAIVLCVQEWTGELRAAGLLSGLFGVGNAVGLTVQGSLMDRYGAQKVVLSAGTFCSLALLGFVTSGVTGAPLWVTGSVILVAGVTVPAITAAVRSWLPTVFAEDSVRSSSYALLSALFRGAVTIGPLLVSASMLLYGAETAVLLAAALILAATVVFSCLGEPESQAQPVSRESRRPRGLNLSAGLVTLLVSAGFIGFAVGTINVAVPGVMTAEGLSALAGVAFAALALGEMVTALGFGSRSWRGQRRTQLLVTQSMVTVSALVVFAVATNPWLVVIAMLGAGAVRAPVSILQSSLLDDVMPKAHLARSYSLLVAVTLVANAAGNAAAGLLSDHMEARHVLLVPVVALGLGSLWVASRYRTLQG